jgi:PAS domain S-box-containing protein
MDFKALLRDHSSMALVHAQEPVPGMDMGRYRTLLELLPTGVFLIQDGRIVFANTALREMAGYGLRGGKEMLPMDGIFIPGTKKWVGMQDPENETGHYEVMVLTASGTVRTWGVRSVRVALESGEAILASAEDLTEKKILDRQNEETRVQLIHESRLSSIGFLAAGIAHNLNNPLTSIYTVAQLIRQEHPEMEEADRIIAQCRTMMNIIRTLMTKSRMDQAGEVSDIDLNELLENELKFYEAKLDFKHKITKKFHFEQGLPLIRCIYSDLSQAVMNIVKNAEDAMCESARKLLSIRTFSDGQDVCIEISDTGCGIPEENLGRIFEPFFTTKPMSSGIQESRPTGTGLGLASSLQLVRKYRGTIQVRSTPGEGTAVTLVLPRRQ